ncbi:hypothetical protein B0T13DRAFT_505777 [Neurospora crassa]|nr:hypothetical protein B0T13DRAFT_505777 [Neurospora crassa]
MNQQRDLVEIGRGNCGSVWAERLSEVDDNSNDNKTVIKREDCNTGRSITKEHDIHKHILTRLAAATMASTSDSNLLTGYRVDIPTAIDFIASTSPEWASLLPRLPKDFQPCKAIRNERIPQMQQHVRQLLAQRFHGGHGGCGTKGEKLAGVLLDLARTEQNCLVRPFLGRRRLPRNRPRMISAVSFRNFPLHLDQIEELGLPKEQYAMAMADTLAFLHWEAEVDARDVEFLLDFDCCKKTTMPEVMDDGGKVATEVAFLEAAAASFWGNDPWYPRPPPPPKSNGNGNGNHGAGSEYQLADRQLWEMFKGRYLETSQQILEGKGKEIMARELPGKVMGMILKTRWKNGKLIYLEDKGEMN